MLVLSRHRDEELMIGDNVMLTVVDIRGDKVRLGIDAPKELPVHRKEVYDAILRDVGVDSIGTRLQVLEWIKPSVRLPTKDTGQVLFCHNGYTWIGNYSTDGYWTYDEGTVVEHEVDYWMPLPTPPTKKEGTTDQPD